MKEVIVIIRYTITEENYQTGEFQDFLNYVQSGDMKNEMHEGDFFEEIKITHQVTDL